MLNILNVVFNPVNKVIFEGALDDLMKEVWCEQLVDVCPRE